MSHNLERLLVRLQRNQTADDIRSEFRHAIVDHAVDRGFIEIEATGLTSVYKLTELGRLAIS